MAITLIKAQGTVKHEQLAENIEFKIEAEHDLPKSYDELTTMYSLELILKHFLKSLIIEIQADMRRAETQKILKANGIEPKGRVPLTPEQKAMNSAMDKMTKEQREQILAQINEIVKGI